MRTEERKKYEKEYYIANKDKVDERQKKYNKLNKEKRKACEKEWREKNKEKIKEDKKQWYLKNGDARNKYLRENKEIFRERVFKYNKTAKYKKYNITEKEFIEMLNKQNGCCAICKTPKEELNSPLHIDHNHETGKVRGLLCMKCNRAIGFFNDRIILLTHAIEYLKNND